MIKMHSFLADLKNVGTANDNLLVDLREEYETLPHTGKFTDPLYESRLSDWLARVEGAFAPRDAAYIKNVTDLDLAGRCAEAATNLNNVMTARYAVFKGLDPSVLRYLI